MTRPVRNKSANVLIAVAAIGFGACSSPNGAPLPDPVVDAHVQDAGTASETAVFAGGCFWGVEAVFEHVKGVKEAVSGYSGGSAVTARYEIVSSGVTGHAESVKVTFDPAQVSYGQLLKVFFSVAHDPTQLNRQGPDTGSQYRSAIFYANEGQKRAAEAYIVQLETAKVYSRPIVTQVVPLQTFYPAEAYHQNYLVNHPAQPYIVVHDLPKLAHLKGQFPSLYAEGPAAGPSVQR